MKLAKNVRFRTVTLSTVKSGTECWHDNRKVIKVRSKTLMDTKGKVYSLPDFTQVRISI